MNERLKNKHFIKHINPNDAVNIYDFAINAKKLTFEEKDILVKNICESKNYYYIVKFIEEIDWLSLNNVNQLVETVACSKKSQYIKRVFSCNGLKYESIRLLVDSICESKQYGDFCFYVYEIKNLKDDKLSKIAISKFVNSIVKAEEAYEIYKFALIVEDLTLIDKEVLVQGIINSKDATYISLFAENIPWLTKKHIDLLTNAISKTNDVHHINRFAQYVPNLTEENLKILASAIIKSKVAKYIYNFATLPNLTKENINDLTKAICKTRDSKFICIFANEIKNLSEENIKSLSNAILKTNNAIDIYKFLTTIEGLTEEEYKVLMDKIFEIKNFGVIIWVISDYLEGINIEKIGTDFEKRILETKDLYIIAYYLFRKKDKKLIKKIFGNMEKFLVFVLLYRDVLDLRDCDIIELQNDYDNKYVDDRVDLYLEKTKTIKK